MDKKFERTAGAELISGAKYYILANAIVVIVAKVLEVEDVEFIAAMVVITNATLHASKIFLERRGII